MTGLPCPLCGATRAFTHVARGDSAFLSYNAFWVLVAVAMIVAGVVVLIKRRPFMDELTRTPRARGADRCPARRRGLGLRARRAGDDRAAGLAAGRRRRR